MRIRKKWLIVGTLGVLGLGSAVSLIPVLSAANRQFQISRAESALDRGDGTRAEPLCRELLEHQADTFDPDTLNKLRRLAAKAALMQGANERAVGYLEPMLKEADTVAFAILDDHAEHLARSGKLEEAEQLLRQTLRFRYDQPSTLQLLADLCRAEGRYVEAQRYYYALIRQRHCRRDWLLFVLDPPLAQVPALRASWSKLTLDSPALRFARLVERAEVAPHSITADDLWELIKQEPEFVSAQARLGLLLAPSDSTGFQQWWQQLPAAGYGHPDVWQALAIYLLRQGQEKEAIRCCWEALRRQPGRLDSYRMLAESLAKLSDPRAKSYANRYDTLQRLRATAARVLEQPNDIPALQQLVTLTNDLGRYWEAWGWALELANADTNDVTNRELVRQIAGHLADDLPVVSETLDVVAQYPLDHYPLPNELPRDVASTSREPFASYRP